ncbi:hypothetical protein CBP51_16965 [Cellvibrio mixtus]|uniref:Uncharacterized protein n=1 Tax=Cellvibrio mixtus TaxID=39650 RepID=A0A266Q4U2_9GAMM|nr:hypothetical protein [Cellvibrio mixtus]OZY84852.1 hypothetical protein CBP51_16965 [Cellvibrio mixtus]
MAKRDKKTVALKCAKTLREANKLLHELIQLDVDVPYRADDSRRLLAEKNMEYATFLESKYGE